MIQSLTSSSVLTGDARATADQKKLKSAAQAFEAVFLRQMISSMRQDGLGDGMFDSEASDTFRDLADAKTADAMAGKGVLGIAGLLEQQLAPVAARHDGTTLPADAKPAAPTVRPAP
ncbi:MAG TPA: rod-binding protein [Sphingomonas sp.]|nr:rod-binding protein [Sphingomonas sp.]